MVNRALSLYLLEIVDFLPSLRQVEMTYGLLSLREFLRLQKGLVGANIDSLWSDQWRDERAVLVAPDEVLAVIDGLALLSSEVLVEHGPAEESSEPDLLDTLGYDILGVVEVHEGRGACPGHLETSERRAGRDIGRCPLCVYRECPVQELVELDIVHEAPHQGHRDMRVAVDQPGHDDASRSVDDFICFGLDMAELDYLPAVHEHVGLDYLTLPVLGYDESTLDQY